MRRWGDGVELEAFGIGVLLGIVISCVFVLLTLQWAPTP